MSVIVGSILIVMGVIFTQSPAQDSLNKGIKAFRDANSLLSKITPDA